MAAAILNLCVDPRMKHDSLRAQMEAQMQSMGLKADRVFITNEPGANIGSAMRNTADMLAAAKEPIVMLAVLQHDDCVADKAGRRKPLETSLRELKSVATAAGFTGPVLAGTVNTASQAIEWTTETTRPSRTYSLLPNVKAKPSTAPAPPAPPANPLRRKAP